VTRPQFAALAAAFFALAIAGPAIAAPSFGTGDPEYTVYPGPEDLPQVNSAGEPSIGVNWKTGSVLYQAFSATYRVRFDDGIGGAGVVWEDAENPTGTLNLDPILFTDPVSGRTLGGGLQGPCGNLAITDADGPPWTKVKPCTGTVDHQTIGGGAYHDPAPAGATFPRVFYYCAQFPLEDNCVTSTDGGVTFGPPVPVIGCNGLHGHVKVGPDGTAYLPNRTCTSLSNPRGIGGGISIDNGVTWTSYAIPDQVTPPPGVPSGFDPSVGITTDNVVYEAWNHAGDNHPMVARSADRGLTWDPPVDLAQTVSPAMVASTFHTVVGGDPGRVAVAYLATQTGDTAANPFDVGFHGVWHLFVSTTFDGGKTWKTTRVTKEPIQRGCINSSGTTALECRNLLDFMDASVTPDGRVLVGLADGCVLECDAPDGAEEQSTSAVATIARQSAGRGLFAAFDDDGSGTPKPPVPTTPAPARNAKPKACFRFSVRKRRLRVDARCSTDTEGPIRAYRWSWGDRSKVGRRAVAVHRYRKRGRYRVTLRVTDAGGRTAVARRKLKLPAWRDPKRAPRNPEAGERD
jgi:hypothetical protein